ALAASLPPTAEAVPPAFTEGTIFIDPNIITPEDPTAFEGAVYAGQGVRRMFDRRSDSFISVNTYLFDATYDDGLAIGVEVNPEFGSSAAAQVEALKYSKVIGQLPTALRADVQTVWIHRGEKPFGGGNNNILIHVDQGVLYEEDGFLEEALVHEASHTSL